MNADSPAEARSSHRRDARGTRANLLAAAEAQFAAHGLAGSRVDKIARGAGVNVQLIYRYFGDKRGLYHAVFDGVLGRYAAHLRRRRAAMGSALSPRQRVRSTIAAQVDFVWDDPAYAPLTLWTMAEGVPHEPGGPSAGLEELQQLGRELVQQEIDAGVLRSDLSVDVVSLWLQGTILGQYGLMRISFPGFEQADHAALRSLQTEQLTEALLGLFGAGSKKRKKGRGAKA